MTVATMHGPISASGGKALAQGIASPVLGLIATGARLNVAFLASSLTVLCAAFIASWLIAHPTTIEGCPQ